MQYGKPHCNDFHSFPFPAMITVTKCINSIGYFAYRSSRGRAHICARPPKLLLVKYAVKEGVSDLRSMYMLWDRAASSRSIPRKHSVSLLVVDVVVVVVVVVVGAFYFRSAHCITWLTEEERKVEGERTLECVHVCTQITLNVLVDANVRKNPITSRNTCEIDMFLFK